MIVYGRKTAALVESDCTWIVPSIKGEPFVHRRAAGRGAIVRGTAYWLFFLWLLLWFGLYALDMAMFLNDSETYRRVYRDPELYFAVGAVVAFLQAVALALHGAGWRTHRFSVAAIAIAILIAGFTLLQMTVGVFVTCCS